MAGMKDFYANIIHVALEESAANTLTFSTIDVGLSALDRAGLLVNRIEYYRGLQELEGDDDVIEFGLSASNSFATADPSEPSVIDYNNFRLRYYGTAANAILMEDVVIRDYSTFPGGGLLITPKPLYGWIKGTNLANVGTCDVRIYFTLKELKPEEYFELLETRTFFV